MPRPFAEEMGGRESGREGCRSDGALAPPWRWALAWRKEREMTAVVARERNEIELHADFEKIERYFCRIV